jgi:hypothetical protein
MGITCENISNFWKSKSDSFLFLSKNLSDLKSSLSEEGMIDWVEDQVAPLLLELTKQNADFGEYTNLMS